MNAQLCLGMGGENEAGGKKEDEGEVGEEESAIERQAYTSQPLSPSRPIVSKC